MRIDIRNPVWSVVVGTGLLALAFSLRQSRWRKQTAATGAGLVMRGVTTALRHEFGQVRALFARTRHGVPS